jgi:tRNA A37 threonylcarbamoyladenosine synthetase subunit TsaC/SUA5/YrdC
VALSSDGNTALIGGFGDNNQIGAAWVFVIPPSYRDRIKKLKPGSYTLLVTATAQVNARQQECCASRSRTARRGRPFCSAVAGTIANCAKQVPWPVRRHASA